MNTTQELARRIAAVAAAFVLAFSGATAFASIGDATGSGDSKSVSTQGKKCKKKSKKCKKKTPATVATPAPTGFVPGRVVEIRYEASAIGGADTPAVYPTGPLFPVNVIVGPGEVLATIEIVDDFSPNASAGFSYDSDGDGLNDAGFDVCGSTPEPVEVIPGTQYNIFPYLLPSTTCTDGVATAGTIKVTFNQV